MPRSPRRMRTAPYAAHYLAQYIDVTRQQVVAATL
jgi:hypothetical protein